MIKLLLVEDEADYALLIRAMLSAFRDTEFAVEEAHSLSAAIQTLQAQTYDLILSDLGLPDSRELATLRTLRVVAAQTPIIVISAHPDAQIPLQAVQEGAQDYLLKGTFNSGALGRVIRYAIERQGILRALHESERQHRAVFDHTLAAIFMVDDERGFITANPAAGRLLGLPLAELIGRRMDDLIEWERAPLLPPAWRRFLATGRMAGEFVVKRPDGATRIIQLESTANVLPGQHLLSMIDITERKQAEEERLVQEKAQAANEAKSEFLSRLSHELRTPLSAILGFAQLLEMSNINAPDRESVEMIMQAGRHLLGLVNQMLDISAIESRQLPLSLETFALDAVLSESTNLIAPAAATRGITITSDIVGLAAWPVLADRDRLKQVLLNLLSNAVKYNRPGGAIIIRYRRDPPDRIRLLISDTGPGIPAAKMSRLFTPFDRLGMGGGAVEGTGLGLVISKQLIEAMRGQVGAESVLGVGSTFWLELPAPAAE